MRYKYSRKEIITKFNQTDLGYYSEGKEFEKDLLAPAEAKKKCLKCGRNLIGMYKYCTNPECNLEKDTPEPKEKCNCSCGSSDPNPAGCVVNYKKDYCPIHNPKESCAKYIQAEPKEKCGCIDRKSNPMIVDPDCPKHSKDLPKLPEKLIFTTKNAARNGDIMLVATVNAIINYLQQKESK